MTWEAMTALATLGSTVAVLITLVYLAVQVHFANTQRQLEFYRHTWDTLNAFCDVISESEARAAIVLKGRDNRAKLSEAEKMVFDHIHIRLLNGLESWQHQLEQTTRPGAFREKQIENIKTIIRLYFGFPGMRTLWADIRLAFTSIHHLVDDTLENPESSAR